MKPGELANVCLWLGADIQRESAERPLLTLSGHSVKYAVQQVGTLLTHRCMYDPSREEPLGFPGCCSQRRVVR